MKSIESLSGLLKLFGWFSIILGLILLVPSIFTHTLSLGLVLSSINSFFQGLVYLGLAHGLTKKEKWAWYTGFFIFSLSFLYALLYSFLFKFSFTYIVSIGISVLMLFLLISGKRIFIKQPKESISQWLRKPYFIMVVAGAILSCLIIGATLGYNYFGVS